MSTSLAARASKTVWASVEIIHNHTGQTRQEPEGAAFDMPPAPVLRSEVDICDDMNVPVYENSATAACGALTFLQASIGLTGKCEVTVEGEHSARGYGEVTDTVCRCAGLLIYEDRALPDDFDRKAAQRRVLGPEVIDNRGHFGAIGDATVFGSGVAAGEGCGEERK